MDNEVMKKNEGKKLHLYYICVWNVYHDQIEHPRYL